MVPVPDHRQRSGASDSLAGNVVKSMRKKNRRRKRRAEDLQEETERKKVRIERNGSVEQEREQNIRTEKHALLDGLVEEDVKLKKRKQKHGERRGIDSRNAIAMGCAEVSDRVNDEVVSRKKKKKKKKSKTREDAETQVHSIVTDDILQRSVENAAVTISKQERPVILVESEFKGVETVAERGSTFVKGSHKYVVHVKRPKDVEKGRETLPIVMMEQEIMEAIQENSTVLVCGETGCGKTTQVPQFLYEAGYGSGLDNERGGMIGVTQPRRVAVLGTARRVSQELSLQLGHEVGFQVRHDRKLGEKCGIKFMTDGILLREVQGDFLLRKYSVIVLDEAHERSLNTDILIGMLSRIVPLRQKLYEQQLNARQKGKTSIVDSDNRVTPLKLVIMSATLRVEDFTSNTRMFPISPPVVRVPARQFPVSVHFSKKTELVDYVGATYKKVCAIHRKLPAGGILVFLTGQREVEDLCRKLRKSFQSRKKKNVSGQSIDGEDQKDLRVSQRTEEAIVYGGISLDKISAAMDEDKVSVDQARNEENLDCGSGDDSYENLTDSEDDSDLEVSEDELLRQTDVLVRLRQKLFSREPILEKNLESSTASSLTSKSASVSPITPPIHTSSSFAKFSEGDSTRACGANLTDSFNERKDVSSISPGLVDSNNTEAPGIDKGKSVGIRNPGPLHVLPLYAMLPAAAQLKVFGDMPKDRRLVVVATNVAETSITIPGIKYVVDSGRAKQKEFDRSSGIAKFEVQWINKASADQRAGRAGRTGPGHCYRLYSSSHFNHSFPAFGVPEIHKSPIEGVVLVMKSMGIDKVVNFPFPTPPDASAVMEAQRCLQSLSAVDMKTGLLTSIGQAMAVYPISPRHSRMLLAALGEVKELSLRSGDVDGSVALAYAIAVAAVLSLDDPFLREAALTGEEEQSISSEHVEGVSSERPEITEKSAENGEEGVFSTELQEHQDRMRAAEKAKVKQRRAKAASAHAKFKNLSSDAISVANALRAYEQSHNREDFCQTHYLHSRTMSEMSQLRKQLKDLMWYNVSGAKSSVERVEGNKVGDVERHKELLAKSEVFWEESSCSKLSSSQEALVRQAICAGWADKVSRKLNLQERAAIHEFQRKKKILAYRGCSTEEPIFLHPSSALSKEGPDYVVYHELVNTSRVYMQRVTAVEATWLVKHAGALCSFSKPLSHPPPWYDSTIDEVMCWVTPSFGPQLWELPLHKNIMKKGQHRTAVFACALLSGKVLPSFKTLSPCLTNDPNIVVKPESQALKRVSDLLHRLTSTRVDTRVKIRECWSKNPDFLYPELLSWVQFNYQIRLRETWQILQQEAFSK